MNDLPAGNRKGVHLDMDEAVQAAIGLPEQATIVLPLHLWHMAPGFSGRPTIDLCSYCQQLVVRSEHNLVPFKLCAECAIRLGMVTEEDLAT